MLARKFGYGEIGAKRWKNTVFGVIAVALSDRTQEFECKENGTIALDFWWFHDCTPDVIYCLVYVVATIFAIMKGVDHSIAIHGGCSHLKYLRFLHRRARRRCG